MPLTVPDQTIAAQGKNPDMMNTLNSIMQYKNAQQNLQLNQQTLQSKDMDLQSQTQANQERQNVNQFMQNPDNFQTNGKIDMDKLNANIPKIAPQTGGELLHRMSTLSQAQTAALTASQNLTQSQRAIVAGPMAVLGRSKQQDPQVYLAELDNLAQENKDNPALLQLINAKKTAITAMPPGADIAKGAVISSQQLLNPDQQQSQLSPQASLVNNGNSLVPTVTTPSVGGNQPSIEASGGAPMPLQLPPTQPIMNGMTPGVIGAPPSGMQVSPQQQNERDQERIKILQNELQGEKDPANQAALKREIMNTQMGINQRAQQPAGQAGFVPTGLPVDAPELMGYRAAANQAAATVGDSRSNNAQIREVLKDTSDQWLDPTGTAAKSLNKLSSYMGFTIAKDAAANFNSISHNLALQQQTNNQRMGVKTDAGSAISGTASGNAEQDRKTLTKAVNISDAGNTGVELFNQGMESAIKNGGISSIRDFRNAWSTNYDVNALRLLNASQRGDKEESRDVMKMLGGSDSIDFKRARQKMMNMEALSKGQIPRESN